MRGSKEVKYARPFYSPGIRASARAHCPVPLVIGCLEFMDSTQGPDYGFLSFLLLPDERCFHLGRARTLHRAQSPPSPWVFFSVYHPLLYFVHRGSKLLSSGRTITIHSLTRVSYPVYPIISENHII